MEFENRHWWRSSVPTGYKNDKPKTIRSKAIHESEYGKLKEMADSGEPISKIAITFGCSTGCIKSTLKAIQTK